MNKKFTLVLSILVALLALTWFILSPSFEPVIIFLGSLIGFASSKNDKEIELESNNINIPVKTWDMLCQPIIDIKTGKICSIELSPDFKCDENSFSYSKLMSSVSEFNQVLPIVESFITFAIKYAQYWHKNFDNDLIITLKLSNSEILNTGYFELLLNILNKYSFPKNLICLELSEEDNFCKETPGILKELKKLGIQFALGNYGTGASCYSALRNLNVQKVIISSTFVGKMESDDVANAMVASIIQVAKTMGLSTRAQGVLNKEQMKLLKEHGCDELQGSVISPFLESNEVLKFLVNYNVMTNTKA